MLKRSWRHRLRRLRFFLGGLVAACLIALAVMIGLVQVLLPLAAHDPDRIATFISRRLDQPVRFAAVEGRWQPSGPLLVLRGVRIGGKDGGKPLDLPVAEVKLDFGGLVLPHRSFVNLRLVDLHLDLERAADGTWSVGGIGAAGSGTNQHLDLRQLPGSLRLDRLRMTIHDARSGRDWHLSSRRLHVSNDGSEVRFAGDLHRPGVAQGLDVAGRFEVGSADGSLYVQGHALDLGRLMEGIKVQGHSIGAGHGDLQAWLAWRHARVVSQTARFDLTGLALKGPAGSTRIARVQGLFGFRRDAGGWSIRYASSQGAAARVRMLGKGDARMLSAHVRHLRLGALLPLVAQAPGMPVSLARWLLKAAPRGLVKQATLRWSVARGLQHVEADVDGLQLDPVGKRPGFGPLQGHVYGDHEAVLVTLPKQATRLRLPHTFRKPIALQSLAGDIVAWHAGHDWHLGTPGLSFGAAGFAGRARGQVRMPTAGGKPFVDLYVALTRGNVDAAKLFWPVDVMSPRAVDWLDRALVDGHLVHAEALIRGDLADWPFAAHQGRFEARGVISGLTLDYSPKWPKAKGVHAIASFVNNSMLVVADAGSSLGNTTDHAVASIPSFHGGQLILDVRGHGSGESMLDFARQSPIAARQAGALSKLSLGGRGQFGFSLMLPLKDAKDFVLGGSARVSGVDVTDPEWGLKLGKLRGTLHFDGKGLSGKGLGVTFNGVPSTMDLALGAGATGQRGHPVSVTLHGHYSVPTLIKGRPVLDPLAKVSTGTADFDLGFDIFDGAKQPVRQVLRVDSDLQGIALDLPAPLDKPAGAILPLHLKLQLPVSGGDLKVSMGQKVQAHARLATDAGAPLALAVTLGAKAPTSLPDSGLRVTGTGRELNVSGWLQRALAASRSPDGSGLRLEGVNVKAVHAHVFGATFDNLHLMLTPQKGQILMQVDGPQAKGTLTLPTQDLKRRGVLAQLDRLYWPDSAAAKSEAKQRLEAAPTAASAAAVPIDYADTGVDPASLPPLHISVNDLRLGKARLGHARFESWPTAKGMHIDQLRTHTQDVQVMASGDWNGTASDSHTHMNIDFGAENLGSLLKTLGFGGLFEGGQTSAHLEASWPGEPSSLAMQRMTGTLRVQVSKGRIPEVQPGMGRLLGLMALTELPRRLSLDFGDVFGKGMSFDSIHGDFRLEDGVADTENLKLKGPAAEITITGQTNLRDKTYNQRILVVPHVGNSLPVLGAITAGPIGAAAGLAIQGLLGHGLNRAASARYSLTGDWEKPKITLIEKNVPVPVDHAAPAPFKAPAAKSPAAPTSVPAPASSPPPASATAPDPATRTALPGA